MSRLYTVLRLGPGTTAAQRQASVIYAGAALLASLGAILDPDLAPSLTAITGICLLVAATAWWLPWRRWPPPATLVLALPAFALLAWVTTALRPIQIAPGAFFVLFFVWAGLHHRPAGVLALTPAAAVAYVWPLVAAGQTVTYVVLRSVLLLAVMMLVGLVIADRVDRLEQAKSRLAYAEQWRSSVMLTLAHDVRSPLTAIQTTLELLAQERGQLSAAEQDRLMDLALRQATRIHRLATELIELERIEAGQVRLRLSDVPVREAIDTALEHAAAPDGVVRVDPPDLRVRADPVRIDQVLVNLVGNARRYGAPPIVVEAEQVGDQVRVSVRDHGAGLPAGTGKRLFQRFSVADRGPDSVGLGLWVARQMVLAHGGDIRYEPAHPGARFLFSLPADGPAHRPSASAQA